MGEVSGEGFLQLTFVAAVSMHMTHNTIQIKSLIITVFYIKNIKKLLKYYLYNLTSHNEIKIIMVCSLEKFF